MKKNVFKKNIQKKKKKTSPQHCWRLYVAGRGCSVWFFGGNLKGLSTKNPIFHIKFHIVWGCSVYTSHVKFQFQYLFSFVKALANTPTTFRGIENLHSIGLNFTWDRYIKNPQTKQYICTVKIRFFLEKKTLLCYTISIDYVVVQSK